MKTFQSYSGIKVLATFIVLFSHGICASGQNEFITLPRLHKMLNSNHVDVIRSLDSAGYIPVSAHADGTGSPSPIYGSVAGWRNAKGKQILFEYCTPSYTECIGFEIDSKSSAIVVLSAHSATCDSLAWRINYEPIPGKDNAFVNPTKDCVLLIFKADKNTLTTFSRQGYGFSKYYLEKKKGRK